MQKYGKNAFGASTRRVNDAQSTASVPALPVTAVARASRPGDVQHTTLGAVLERFRRPNEHLQALISRIRTARSKEERDALKRELAQVVFSGTFERRQSDAIRSYAGILTVDLDADQNPGRDLPAAKPLLASDPYVLAAFVSPSGHGLKLLVRVAEPIPEVSDPKPLQKAHARAARAFFGYLQATYGLIADQGCTDLARACFATVDPELHFNPDAEIFRFRHEVELPPVASSGDGAADLELIESALAALPLDGSLDYHLWLKVLFALASAVGEDAAVELMLKHTRDARDTEEYIRQRLKSYRGEVQLGTLFWLAGQYGWRPTRKQREQVRAGDGQQEQPQVAPDPAEDVPFWQPFPVDLLPRPVADLVHAGAAAIPCDPALIAIPSLATLSAAVGSHVRLRLKRKWVEPAALWTLIAAPSGTGKSPAQALAVEPVLDLEARAAREYEAALEAYRQRLEDWEALPKDQRQAVPKPEVPRARRFRVADVTIEALAPILKENARGVLLWRDELNTWLMSFDRYAQRAGADLSAWVEMYEARPIAVDRKTADGPIRVERPFVAVTGGIQPHVLQQHVSPIMLSSGFIPRFILAMPPQTRRSEMRWDADVSEEVAEAYARLIRRLYGLEEAELTLSPEAREVFQSWILELDQEREGLPDGPLRSASLKAEAWAARIALILQCAEGVLQGRPPREVSGEVMARAVGIARWCWHEQQRVYALMGWRGVAYEALTRSPAERVLDEMPEHFTTGDWITVAMETGAGTQRTAERWLAALVEMGKVERLQRGHYSKPTHVGMSVMSVSSVTPSDSASEPTKPTKPTTDIASVRVSETQSLGPGGGLGGSDPDGPPVASVAPAGDLQDGWIRLLPDDEGGADDQPNAWFDPFEDEPEPAAEARPTTPPDVPNDPAELRAFVLQRAEAAGWPSLWLDGFGATHGLPKMWQAAVERLSPERLRAALEMIENLQRNGAPF